MSARTYAMISIVTGALSIVPFPYLGYFAPVSLLFAIIALFKRQIILAIVGLILSVVGFATSPMLWALGWQGYCMVADCSKMMANAAAPVLDKMKVTVDAGAPAPAAAAPAPTSPVVVEVTPPAPAPAVAPGLPAPSAAPAPVVVQVTQAAAPAAPVAPAPNPAAAPVGGISPCMGRSASYKTIPGWEEAQGKDMSALHGAADILPPLAWTFASGHKADGAFYYHDDITAPGKSFAQIIDDSIAKVKAGSPNMSFSKIDGQKTADGHPLVLVRFAGLSNGRSEIAAFADGGSCFEEIHVLSAPTDQAMTDNYAAFVQAVVGITFK